MDHFHTMHTIYLSICPGRVLTAFLLNHLWCKHGVAPKTKKNLEDYFFLCWLMMETTFCGSSNILNTRVFC